MQESSLQSNVKINFVPIKNKKKISTFKSGNKKITFEEMEGEDILKPKKELPLRIGILGGLQQIGQNMMFMEYRSDIIIIDCGLLMPGGEMYGVDYIIPDISYLKPKKEKIKGIFITHGHLDHIGALKYILPDLDYPIVYGTALAIGLIKKLFDGNNSMLNKFKYQIINPDIDFIKLGAFNVDFIRVNHNIPEAVALAIHTPKGLIINTGDFKIDFTPAIDKVADLAKLARIGQEGVKLLLADSTNATKPGKTISERQIGASLEEVIKKSNKRLIIATYSTLIGRIAQIIEYSVKYNKIIFLSGRSMINNVEIARQLGYINAPQGIIRKLSTDVDSLPDEKVVILTTGSQGEEFSALVRIANGEHQQIKIRAGDKILISAVPIPGNEKAVVNMKNELIRKGADVITNEDLDLHVSGHGNQEDLKMMFSLVKPEFFAPIHGELYMRDAHIKLAQELGIDKKNTMLLENGQILEVRSKSICLAAKSIKLDTIIIDGLGIGHLSGEYVMKARKIMAEDGMVCLIFKIDSVSKDLVGNIQIESRGFVYSSEVKHIHTKIVEFAKRKYYELFKSYKNIKDIMKQIKEGLSTFMVKTVGRSPMFVPMFVYINRENLDKTNDIPEEEALVGMTLDEQGVE